MPAEPRSRVARLPTTPGVYRFRDARGRALYLGRAVNLRRRVGSYFAARTDRPHLAGMVRHIARIEAVECDSEHEAAWLERNLLEHGLPPYNRTPGGAEVPVYLQMDERAGLRVLHSGQFAAGARVFGPYLGGAKVRLAASALHRMLPLPYTTGRLTGAERDLARLHGVGPADRPALMQAVVAVLDRDPDAVAWLRDELARRRDAAADIQAFELAARLHTEIAAVDWVCADQKVTVREPYDCEAHGWCEGLLVSFEIRDGRLRTWRQRVCAEATAKPRLTATPPPWRGFARRSAELAARVRN